MSIRTFFKDLTHKISGEKLSKETSILSYIKFPKIDVSFKDSKEYKSFLSYRNKQSTNVRKYHTPTTNQRILKDFGYCVTTNTITSGIMFACNACDKVVAPETSIIADQGILKGVRYLLLYGLDTTSYHLLANVATHLPTSNAIIKSGTKLGVGGTEVFHGYHTNNGWVDPEEEFYEKYAQKLRTKFIKHNV